MEKDRGYDFLFGEKRVVHSSVKMGVNRTFILMEADISVGLTEVMGIFTRMEVDIIMEQMEVTDTGMQMGVATFEEEEKTLTHTDMQMEVAIMVTQGIAEHTINR